MAKVITTNDPSFAAFTAATQHAQSRAQAAEAERAATEAARLALPTQVQAITGPAVQAAQSAASLAVQRAGVVGSVPNDAALAGRAAGDYRIGTEIVSWSGTAITARTGVLAADADVQALRLSSVTDLATLPALPGDVLMVAGSRGGRFVVKPAADAPPADGGVVFALPGDRVAVREREGRVRGVWYGLVPDGDLTLPGAGTDNGPALTALFEAVNRYGGLIDLDAGTYRSSVRLPTLGNKPFRLEAGGAALVFSVRDLGASGIGMPMLTIQGASNWHADIGLIRQLGLPLPNAAMAQGDLSAMRAPAGWGTPFHLWDGIPDDVYWRTHNDHGCLIADCADYELHVRVDAVRAMGVVARNSQRGIIHARVKGTLADGFHCHGGSCGNRLYIDADSTADDGVALVNKAGEPPMLDNWVDATSTNSWARGVTISGTQNTHLARADVRDAYSEGVLILAEALEGELLLYTRVGDVFAMGCGRRADRLTAQAAGFRIGYPNSGRREHYTEIGSIRAINNLGPGVVIGGQFTRIGSVHSQGNGGEDVYQQQGDLQVGELTCEDGHGLVLDGLTSPQIGRLTARRNAGTGVRLRGTTRAKIERLRAYQNTMLGVQFVEGSTDNEIDWIEVRDNGSARPAGERVQISCAGDSPNNAVWGGRIVGQGEAVGGEFVAPTHLRDVTFEGFSAAVPPIAASPAALAGSRWSLLRGWGLSRGTNLEGNPYGATPVPVHATPVTVGPHRVRVHVTERAGATLQGLNVTRNGVTTDYIQAAPNVRTLELEPGDTLNPYWAGGTVTWFWEIN